MSLRCVLIHEKHWHNHIHHKVDNPRWHTHCAESTDCVMTPKEWNNLGGATGPHLHFSLTIVSITVFCRSLSSHGVLTLLWSQTACLVVCGIELRGSNSRPCDNVIRNTDNSQQCENTWFKSYSRVSQYSRDLQVSPTNPAARKRCMTSTPLRLRPEGRGMQQYRELYKHAGFVHMVHGIKQIRVIIGVRYQ